MDAKVGRRGWTKRLDTEAGHLGWMQRLDSWTQVGCIGWDT